MTIRITIHRGTADYFGLNHYSSRLVEFGSKGGDALVPSALQLIWGIKESVDPSWKSEPHSNMKVMIYGINDLASDSIPTESIIQRVLNISDCTRGASANSTKNKKRLQQSTSLHNGEWNRGY